MTEYFGMNVRELYPGQVQEYLDLIDPLYWEALVAGVHYLSQDQEEPVQDHYFTAIHGTIMEMENVISRIREQYRDKTVKHDYSIYEEKK